MRGEIVIIEDLHKRIYCCRRIDLDNILREHPELKTKLCELVTVYISDNYIGLWGQLMNNGVFE